MVPHIWIVGAGFMGRSALQILARDLPAATFTVVDRDPEVQAKVADLAPGRVATIVADVQRDDLDPTDADVVLNLAGPFFGGSSRLAEMCISSKSNYLDIADDVEGTTAILGLDDRARDAGVWLVTGAGLSPGVSNWLAAELLDAEPEADGIQIAWVVHESDPGGLAPLRHMLHMAVSPCPLWVDGRLIESPGFVPSTAQSYEFPDPIGSVEALDTAHPEPLTLSRAYPHLRFVSCQGSLRPAWANAAFSTLGRIGFGYDTPLEFHGEQVEPVEFLWELMWDRHRRRAPGPRDPYTSVQVQALSGSTVIATRTVIDDEVMARGTGLGAASAVITALSSEVPVGAHGAEVLPHTVALDHFTRLAARAGGFRPGIVGR